MSPDAVRAVCDQLRAPGESLFALLDAARDPAVLFLIRDGGRPHQSLYEGAEADDLAAYGPYLVDLDGDDAFLPRLVERGWGRSWGVYLASPADLATVRRHLRRYLKVEIPGGRTALFRFYDPRVLREFLPSWADDERDAFFGPVSAYVIEAADAGVGLHRACPVEVAHARSVGSRGDR